MSTEPANGLEQLLEFRARSLLRETQARGYAAHGVRIVVSNGADEVIADFKYAQPTADDDGGGT